MSASTDTQEFAQRLEQVPPYARKLLAHAAELAYGAHPAADERAPDVAYLPELHESCGLDVESMYASLQQLETAGLIDLEGEYPFQDVHLRHAALRELVQQSRTSGVPLHEVLGELRFERIP